MNEKCGRIKLANDEITTYFKDLSATYPQKLISPSLRKCPVGFGLVYVLSYGGGLVAGDECNLNIDIENGSTLMMLTQGSTKVFKSDGLKICKQNLTANMYSDSLLILLPDSIQPFKNARYKQRQVINLFNNSSAIILDSFNGGRVSRGELWEFDQYTSINTIYVDGILLIHDAQHLRQPFIMNRLEPFTTYAMLFLIGNKTASLRRTFESLNSQQNSVLNFKFNISDDVLWSYTIIDNNSSIVRIACKDEQNIKNFLKTYTHLGGLEDLIGVEAFVRCFK